MTCSPATSLLPVRRALALLVALATVTLGLAQAPAADAGHFQFPDVPRGHFAHTAVDWGFHNHVTSGVGHTGHFFPTRDITRAELVTMLWRANGGTRVSGALPPDVPAGHFGAPAIRWALRKGITTGIGGTGLFGPDLPITRAEIVTMLWRANNRPGASAHLLPDVPSNHWSATATRWAWEEGVSYGVGATGQFQPHRNLSRGEAITFVYRDTTGAKAPNPHYAFYGRGADGEPWKWNGCVPIYYFVDYAGAHANATRVLPEAIRRLQRDSGLTFVQVGTPEEANLGIVWRSPSQDQVLRDNPGVAGYAGFDTVSDGRRVRIAVAGVVINSSYGASSQDFGGRNSLGTLLLHELGHAVGLAHVQSDSQVMYPFVTPHANYQAGDRNGLAQLGPRAACALAADAGPRSVGLPDEIVEADWHIQF
ncbi:S-layer homology domain-containing protein [Actinomarinicola tropica]|uniref:Matrixin family metalloprotease n=1 Tax=Actinomarinicola tropica TaxID=2789776 RepID=A0A5Q2RA87_9ACTN|nr:S-layer homology domain-containing protein [Actinomarinicola tropica]QGG93738.1 matrixin family metalloprotease [Actinomarinicola tropica]